MYFHNVAGTGSYTTSTTNMYNKYRFHVPGGDEAMLAGKQTAVVPAPLQIDHDRNHHVAETGGQRTPGVQDLPQFLVWNVVDMQF